MTSTPDHAPAGLLGDMTALALGAGVRGMTVEAVHTNVIEICKRHGLQPATPERDRLKAAGFAQSLMSILAAIKRPDISDDRLDAALDALLDDIRNRLNITIHEMQENA